MPLASRLGADDASLWVVIESITVLWVLGRYLAGLACAMWLARASRGDI